MTTASEWRLSFPWADVQRGFALRHVVASGEERAFVARLLALPDVGTLEAGLQAMPWLDGVEISGELRAVVTLTCGVSLELFDREVTEPIFVRIVPPGSANAPSVEGGALTIDPDAVDPPDILEDGAVDVASLLIEHLALALPPFPRKLGAEFVTAPEAVNVSPFAALAGLSDHPDDN